MQSDFFTSGHTPVNGVARTVGLTEAGTVVVPQGATVNRIFIRENAAAAVTGGIKVGTTVGGTDVLAAGAVAASAVVAYAPLISAVDLDSERTLYVDAVTAWNSAEIDIAVEYTELV